MPLIIPAMSDREAFVTLKTNRIGNVFDSLKIVSDAPTYDSICYIYAKIIEPGIVCESYDFGRKEIIENVSSDKFYHYDSLKIWNYGKYDVQINSIDLISQNESYFDIDSTQLINKIIPKNSFIQIKVNYKPLSIGNQYAEFMLVLKDNIEVKSSIRLSGIGTQAKLQVIDTLDFGKVLINSPVMYESIEIKNESYEFECDIDSLEITYSNSELTKNYFSLNYVNSKINIGESLNLVFTFSPKVVGDYLSEINLAGNYNGNKKIIIKGQGVDSKLEVADLDYNALACEGQKDTIGIVVKNNGSTDLILEPLQFDPIIPEFSFLNADVSLNEIIIPPKSEKTIYIEFTSFGVDKKINLILKDKSKLNPVIIELDGKNKLYENIFNIKPIKQSVEVSQPAMSSVILSGNQSLKESKIDFLNITLTFDPSILSLQEKTLTLGNNLKSDFIIDNVEKISEGKYKFDLFSLDGKYIDENEELVSFIFNTYLSNSINNNTSKVKIDITTKNSECVLFKTDEVAEIETILKCGNELQKINSNLTEFKISDVSPNPLSNSTNLIYSVPYDCIVTIQLIDINGNIVRQYFNDFQKSGFYNFDFNINNISNGYYFLVYKAGTYSTQQAVVINK